MIGQSHGQLPCWAGGTEHPSKSETTLRHIRTKRSLEGDYLRDCNLLIFIFSFLQGSTFGAELC